MRGASPAKKAASWSRMSVDLGWAVPAEGDPVVGGGDLEAPECAAALLGDGEVAGPRPRRRAGSRKWSSSPWSVRSTRGSKARRRRIWSMRTGTLVPAGCAGDGRGGVEDRDGGHGSSERRGSGGSAGRTDDGDGPRHSRRGRRRRRGGEGRGESRPAPTAAMTRPETPMTRWRRARRGRQPAEEGKDRPGAARRAGSGAEAEDPRAA